MGSHRSGRGGQPDVTLTLVWLGRLYPEANKMLSVIGSLAICMHGPGHHLDPFVWFDPLATNHTWSIPGMCIPGARKRMRGSWSSLPSYGGSEGDNTQIPPVAAEEPVVSSSCSKNKHLLSTSICSDQC